MNPEPDLVLDTRGLNCPEPVMMLHQQVRKAAPGALIRLEATDPSTQRDVPKFCQFLHHELVASNVVAGAEGDLYVYLIRRNDG